MSDFNRYLVKEGLTLPESRALTKSANRYMVQPDTISQPQQHDGTQMWNPTMRDYAEFGLGFTPAGVAIDVNDMRKGVMEGNPFMVGAGAVGMVPIIGDVAKPVIKNGGKRLMDALEIIFKKSDNGYSSELLAMLDGKSIGKVEYGKALKGSDDGDYVRMIEVDKDYRRQGVGTKLLENLQSLNPSKELRWGIRTPEGKALTESAVNNKTLYRDAEKALAKRNAVLDKIKALETEIKNFGVEPDFGTDRYWSLSGLKGKLEDAYLDLDRI